MKHKFKEWLKRYGPAEIVAVIFIIVFGNILKWSTGSILLAAFLIPWFENIGYYGTIILQDIRAHRKKYGRVGISGFFKLLIGSIIEFGPAEYIDSLIVRPALLALFPLFIPNYTLAIFAASMVANISFYIPTIIGYEVKKKIVK